MRTGEQGRVSVQSDERRAQLESLASARERDWPFLCWLSRPIAVLLGFALCFGLGLGAAMAQTVPQLVLRSPASQPVEIMPGQTTASVEIGISGLAAYPNAVLSWSSNGECPWRYPGSLGGAVFRDVPAGQTVFRLHEHFVATHPGSCDEYGPLLDTLVVTAHSLQEPPAMPAAISYPSAMPLSSPPSRVRVSWPSVAGARYDLTWRRTDCPNSVLLPDRGAVYSVGVDEYVEEVDLSVDAAGNPGPAVVPGIYVFGVRARNDWGSSAYQYGSGQTYQRMTLGSGVVPAGAACPGGGSAPGGSGTPSLTVTPSEVAIAAGQTHGGVTIAWDTAGQVPNTGGGAGLFWQVNGTGYIDFMPISSRGTVDRSVPEGTTHFWLARDWQAFRNGEPGVVLQEADVRAYRQGERPLAPTVVNAPAGASTNAITVSWPAVTGATYYTMGVLRQSCASTYELPSPITATSYTTSQSLIPGNGNYYFSVRACNDWGCSDARVGPTGVASGSTITGLSGADNTNACPGAEPTTVSNASQLYSLQPRVLVPQGETSGGASFVAAAERLDTGANTPAWESAVLTIQSAGGVETQGPAVFGPMRHFATVLLSGPTHVRLYRSQFNIGAKPADHTLVLNAVSVPGPITSLALPQNLPACEVRVDWTESPGALNYQVQYRYGAALLPGNSWRDVHTPAQRPTTPYTTLQLGNLPPPPGNSSSQIFIRVRGCNADACGADDTAPERWRTAGPMNVTVANPGTCPGGAAVLPLPPTGLAASSTGFPNFRLTWRANAGGAFPNYYVVARATTDAPTVWTEFGTLVAHRDSRSSEQYFVNVVSQNKPHLLRVKACISAGNVCSAWSDETEVKFVKVFHPKASPIPPVLPGVPPINPESDRVGSLPGELTVDASGAANYRIPIELPQGRAGLQPNFAISYSSAAGETELGRGFRIDGLSSITRCRQTKEHGDGEGPFAPILFADGDAGDRYCLDGQRLQMVSGIAYGAVPSEYRTEIDQSLKIVKVSTDQFVVYAPNGMTRTYGSFPSELPGEANLTGLVQSTLAGTSQIVTLAWNLVRDADAFDSTINYRYAGSTLYGSRRLVGADYVGGSVEFVYYDLGPAAIKVQYVSGAPFTRTHYLSSVKVLRGDTGLISYKLNYADVVVENPSSRRLNSIAKCSFDETVCQEPTTFSWRAIDLSQVQLAASGELGDYVSSNSARLGDMDGDGRADLVYLRENDFYRYEILWRRSRTESGSFGLSGRTRAWEDGWFSFNRVSTLGGWHLRDLTGDGEDDLILARDVGSGPGGYEHRFQWQWIYSEGGAFSDPQTPTGNLWSFFAAGAQIGDVDGDGIADVIRTPEIGAIPGVATAIPEVRLHRRSSANFGRDQDVAAGRIRLLGLPSTSNGSDGACRADRLSHGFPAPAGYDLTSVVDINGDGRTDLIFLLKGNCGQSLPNGLASLEEIPFQSTPQDVPAGDATNVESAWQGVFVQCGFSTERSDFCMHSVWKIAGSNAEIDSDDKSFRVLDINGDSLGDVLYKTRDDVWKLRLNTGNTTSGTKFKDPTCIRPDCAPLTRVDRIELLDYDGDGALDLWEPSAASQNPYVVFPWIGTRFAAVGIPTGYVARSGADHRRLLVDLDGDGTPDNLVINEDGNRYYAIRRPTAHHQPVGVIHRVADGLGAVTDVEYAPMTYSDVYRRDFSAALQVGRGSAVQDVSGPSWVVKRVRSSSPTAETPSAQRSTRYRYVGMKIQAGGRGSLGMRIVESLDEQKKIQTRTEYRQDWPHIGQVSRQVTTLLPNLWPDTACTNPDASTCMTPVPDSERVGGLTTSFDRPVEGAIKLSETAYHYSTRPSLSVPTSTREQRDSIAWPKQVLSDSQETNTYALEGGAQLSRAFSINQSHDAYGNPGLTVSKVWSGAGTGVEEARPLHVTEVFTDYLNQTSPAWRLGQPTRVETRSHLRFGEPLPVPDRVINIRTYEYDRGQVIAEHQLGDGQSILPDGGLDQVLHTYHSLDLHGNRIKTVQCSNHSELVGADAAGCRATNANSVAPASVRVSPELWVQRYSRVEYDSQGLFVDRTFGAFEISQPDTGTQVSSVTERNAWGSPARVIDANDVVTQTYYGTFGALYGSGSSQGTQSVVVNAYCTVVTCPPGAVYRSEQRTLGGSTSWTYHDRLGRNILSLGRVLGNQVNGVEAEPKFVATRVAYDVLGRTVEQTVPTVAQGPATSTPGAPVSGVEFKTQQTFDVLDRPVLTTNPDGGVIQHEWDGLKATTTLPRNGPLADGSAQQRIEEKNVLGQVVRVTDAAGLVVDYSYDPQGNLRSTTRPADDVGGGGAFFAQMTYDALNRKISMTDADKGSYRYSYNAAGQAITEVAENATCEKMSYDRMGRMIRRDSFDNTLCSGTPAHSGRWRFDSARNGLGQLAMESAFDALGAPLIQRTFAFDAFARPSTVSTMIDGKDYLSTSTFDEFSRPFQTLFKSVTDEMPETGERYYYDLITGQMTKTVDAMGGANAPAYARVEVIDSFGNVTREIREAGEQAFSVFRQYNPATGRIEWQRAGIAPVMLQQDLEYRWDLVGNLSWRYDRTGGRALYERFAYDHMQRLTGQWKGTSSDPNQQIEPVLAMQYARSGNVVRKNGADYNYNGNGCSGRPHAVCSVPLASKFYTYDTRGNQLTDGQGRALTYLPFNLPSQILNSSSKVAFAYGPNHERIKRVNYASAMSAAPVVDTTYFLGGNEVRRKATGDVEIQRYVGGILLKQRKPAGSSGAQATVLLQYQWLDYQGSVTAVTELDGTPVGGAANGQMGYDAFGARRGADGSIYSTALQLNYQSDATTRHGYTGHEMVDSVGLIHMNGRMYDPDLARFIQADPFIQDPLNSQSLNRYSYVMNNPMNATDPSGMLASGGNSWGGFFENTMNYYSLASSFGIVPALPGQVDAFLRGNGVFQGALWGSFSASSSISSVDFHHENREGGFGKEYFDPNTGLNGSYSYDRLAILGDSPTWLVKPWIDPGLSVRGIGIHTPVDKSPIYLKTDLSATVKGLLGCPADDGSLVSRTYSVEIGGGLKGYPIEIVPPLWWAIKDSAGKGLPNSDLGKDANKIVSRFKKLGYLGVALSGIEAMRKANAQARPALSYVEQNASALCTLVGPNRTTRFEFGRGNVGVWFEASSAWGPSEEAAYRRPFNRWIIEQTYKWREILINNNIYQEVPIDRGP